MSILNVEHLTHGFGDRAILQMYPFAFSRENILDWWAQTEKENPLF